ncbi:hypothetical protein [Streptomyces sp. NPDC017940]|uniref:hypothetical protein n=1 Tax=Streptomyces sp. NPDC017940 TaxID=3365017 RepID=UPI0037A353C3
MPGGAQQSGGASPQAAGGGCSGPPGGSGTPPPCRIPHFSPLHVRGGRRRLRRLMRHRRRTLAAGLAMTAAALAAAGPPVRGEPGARGAAESAVGSAGSAGSREASGRGGGDGARERSRRAARPVTAPVRIADAATVRLLRPGVRVDVVAVEGPGAGADHAEGVGVPRVVASGARVAQVPEASDTAAGEGALVLLSVPRATAARLAGASATARLAVTLR